MSEKFNDSLKKLCLNDQHRDDLKHVVIMALLEKDDDEIKRLYESDLMLYYAIGIIRNQYHSSTSRFNKDHRIKDRLIIDDIVMQDESDITERVFTEKIEQYLLREIDWFSSHIFTCYYFNKVDRQTGKKLKPLSYRKIQNLHKIDDMKIDYNKVAKIVKRTMSEIKNKLERDGHIREHNGQWYIDPESFNDGLVDS